MYIDKLQDSTKQIDYMIRGKGLTQSSIKYATDSEHHSNYMSLYKSIYEGNSQTFDLTKGQPCFSMNKFTHCTLQFGHSCFLLTKCSIIDLNMLVKKLKIKYKLAKKFRNASFILKKDMKMFLYIRKLY